MTEPRRHTSQHPRLLTKKQLWASLRVFHQPGQSMPTLFIPRAVLERWNAVAFEHSAEPAELTQAFLEDYCVAHWDEGCGAGVAVAPYDVLVVPGADVGVLV